MELIDRQALIHHLKIHCDGCGEALHCAIEAPTVDAVEVPCKIGDCAWAIRNFKGHKHPQRGIIADMFFTRDMKLMIAVKYVSRGEWGKTVFATYEEACAAIGAKMDGGAEDGK